MKCSWCGHWMEACKGFYLCGCINGETFNCKCPQALKPVFYTEDDGTEKD